MDVSISLKNDMLSIHFVGFEETHDDVIGKFNRCYALKDSQDVTGDYFREIAPLEILEPEGGILKGDPEFFYFLHIEILLDKKPISADEILVVELILLGEIREFKFDFHQLANAVVVRPIMLRLGNWEN